METPFPEPDFSVDEAHSLALCQALIKGSGTNSAQPGAVADFGGSEQTVDSREGEAPAEPRVPPQSPARQEPRPPYEIRHVIRDCSCGNRQSDAHRGQSTIGIRVSASIAISRLYFDRRSDCVTEPTLI